MKNQRRHVADGRKKTFEVLFTGQIEVEAEDRDQATELAEAEMAWARARVDFTGCQCIEPEGEQTWK